MSKSHEPIFHSQQNIENISDVSTKTFNFTTICAPQSMYHLELKRL